MIFSPRRKDASCSEYPPAESRRNHPQGTVLGSIALLAVVIIIAIPLSIAALFLMMLLAYFPILAMVYAASNATLRRAVSIRQSFQRAASRQILEKFAGYVIRILVPLIVLGFGLVLLAEILIPQAPEGFVEYSTN